MSIGRDDIEREQSLEELRKLALLQHDTLKQMFDTMLRKAREYEFRTGAKGEVQRVMALIAEATKPLTAAAAAQSAPSVSESRKEKKARAAHGPTAQPNLPIITPPPFTMADDDPDRLCKACGEVMAPMSEQTEDSDMIDLVEVSYRLVQVKRQKYRCACGGCIETAPGPARAASGSRYSLAFAAKVLVDKYIDHIPLERQVRIMGRHDLVVTSQTLWDLAHGLAKELEPTALALRTSALAQPVIGLDQTGWPRLEGGADKPWQMWAVTAPSIASYSICDDKSAATFADLLAGYKGVVVCDAASTHTAGAASMPDVSLAGCWAHVFRKFEDAKADFPVAAEALTLIGDLYDLDEQAGDDIARKAKFRRSLAPPVLQRLHDWLMQRAGDTLISIGKAARYALSIWNRLVRFVEDARIPLDNNATERAIRGPVVGRNNHYGSKSRSGTVVAATIYSLVDSAKLCGINPAAYLHAAVLTARDGGTLTPAQFAARSA